MGGSSWSDDHYADRAKARADAGTPTFAYTHSVNTGAAPARAHAKLDPHGVTRESRDSAAHPQSVAIGVMFDVTGSMGSVPQVFQQKLPQLMALLLRKSYVVDPQVLCGAIGDAYADKVPLQVGQFESGVEMDEDLANIYLEGGGGGQVRESYELALYFFARHTSIDCHEKRGKKGYLFLTGDEMSHESISHAVAEQVFGDNLREPVRLAQVLTEAQEKYEVFFIIPQHTHHGQDPKIAEYWKRLVGPERVILLEDEEAICETIGATIGLCEGAADHATVLSDLRDHGASDKVIRAVEAGTSALARSGATAGTGILPATSASGGGTSRI